MAIRNPRQLPTDIFEDELLMQLPLEVRWTGVGLRLYADDQGREAVNALLLKSALWPLDPSITPAHIEDHLLELDRAGYIGIYAAEGRTFYALAAWLVVAHAKPSRHPAPPANLFQKAAGSSLESFSAVEREREGGRGWAESDPAGSLLALPPSPFCKLHQPSGTLEDCRHCGTARLAQEQWLREQRAGTQSGTGPVFRDYGER